MVDRGAAEEVYAVQQAYEHGIDVKPTSMRQLRMTDVTAQTLCVGTVPFLRQALLGAGKLPPHTPYPTSLRPYLKRRTGSSPSLRILLADRPLPIFVKPADGWKRFTGVVLEHPSSARDLGISRYRPLFWSEKVYWLSEWRTYCVRGNVLDLQRAPNTPPDGPAPDKEVVAEAAAAYYKAGGPSGVILDFGVLASGETALVEANDGFSFGAYGEVTASTMWAVWTARWPELVAARWNSAPQAEGQQVA